MQIFARRDKCRLMIHLFLLNLNVIQNVHINCQLVFGNYKSIEVDEYPPMLVLLLQNIPNLLL